MEESLARGEMERSTKDNHIRQEHHSWPSEANKSLFNGTVSRDCQPLLLWSTGLNDFSGLLDYTKIFECKVRNLRGRVSILALVNHIFSNVKITAIEIVSTKRA